jgi:polyhydroxyalkanoate synthesis repressor PhaR
MENKLIKKYPNRRLYDTEASKYITLSDLKKMITEGALVTVLDSTTEEDITRNILMQIIMEAESKGEPIFNTAMLQQIIRFYGGSLQGMFAHYLENSLQLFAKQQAQVKDTLGTDPISMMTKMTEQNMKMWGEFQNSFFGSNSSKKDPENEDKNK